MKGMNDDSVRAPMVITHEGGMRFAAQVRTHRIVTDQPQRAGGTDSGPSPVELLGGSLGSCIAFYVQQFCQARGLPYQGMQVEVEQRGEKNPARVAEFVARVLMPADLPEQYMPMLERVVRSCPAHNTLAHGAAVDIEIVMPVGVT
jgi:putative redox protein